MVNRDKTILSIQNRINESRNKNGIAVTIALSTLRDVHALLKEKQDEIIPYIDIDEAKCPDCKVKLTRQELLGEDVLFEDFFDYCPHCGKAVKWQ